jgi:hypothetical protein
MLSYLLQFCFCFWLWFEINNQSHKIKEQLRRFIYFIYFRLKNKKLILNDLNFKHFSSISTYSFLLLHPIESTFNRQCEY